MLKRLLARLTGHRPASDLPDALTYEDSRRLVAEGDPDAQAALAARTDAAPEVLYYLARNGDETTRRRVAANPANPAQADQLLAEDADHQVRCELARKIGRLIPDLEDQARARLRDRMLDVMETLAADQMPQVRRILAEEIKRSHDVPHAIVRKLAEDLELIVCAPILEYSPLLSDEDLIEIVATTQVDGAVAAVARRSQVSTSVSDAVVASFDVPAVAALLVNPNAQIREETLDRIVEQAGDVELWHEPLVMRPDLSVRAIRRIAGFVASALVHQLAQRNGLPPDLAEDLSARARERIRREVPPDERDEAHRRAEEAARAMKADGRLDETAVNEAIDAGKRELVLAELAILAGVDGWMVRRIIASRSGKAVCALAHSAHLGMRTALKLQSRIAMIPSSALVHAGPGGDYPISRDEVEWHLDFFRR